MGRVWFIIVVAVVMAVVLAGVYGYRFCQEQRLTREDAFLRIEKQRMALEFLQKDVEGFHGQFNDALAAQDKRLISIESETREVRDLLPQMKESIEKIKAVIAQSQAQAFAIKEDAKQWQKDYVSVLLELDGRLNAADTRFKAFQERLPEGALEKLRQEMESLKDSIKKTDAQPQPQESEKKPSLDAAFSSLPRYYP